jgi:ribosomal protein S18 acetylase RimI-like enzyme
MSGASPFEYRTEVIRTPALVLSHYLVPWDTAIIGAPVAQIDELEVTDVQQARRDYERFAEWCQREQVAVCACRLPADRLVESMLLEERGFRFVELNYQPRLTDLQTQPAADEGIVVADADELDREPLAAMAAEVFRYGRLHQDPRLGPALGNRRYRAWMSNAFANPRQRVVKCLLDDRIVAFFVVETPSPNHCFWSLVGLAPGLQSAGLGKRVWRAMLQWHRAAGVQTVSTSISSHNVPAFNLYVSLGFRFPQPTITLQWCGAPLVS